MRVVLDAALNAPGAIDATMSVATGKYPLWRGEDESRGVRLEEKKSGDTP